MSAWSSDCRGAVRSLRASPGFSAIAVSTLGGGLALAITVLTVLDAYLLQSMPYPEADRLYRLDYAPPGQPWPEGLSQVDWDALGDVIETPIAWDLDVFYMIGGGSAGGGHPETVPGAWITPGYVDGFGIRAAAGRTLEARDFDPAAPPVALISHRLWHARFRGDPAVVGRTFTAYVSDRPDEAETIAIVGVLPASFWHMNPYTDVLAPLRTATYPYVVRLRDGVSPAAAGARISAGVRATQPSLPADWRASVTRLQAHYTAAARPMLWVVSAGAALVLVIAAANVAVLLLVRGLGRQGDFAIRLALGAGRPRLVRMLALEGLLLGGGAAAAGVVVSRLALGTMAPAIESFLGRRIPGGTAALGLDGTVLTAVAGCGLLVVLLFTLVPLVSLRSGRLATSFASGRTGTETRGSRRARAVLIAVEVAASLTLIAGATLMVRSAWRMLDVDFGIGVDRVASAGLSMRQRSYPDAASQAAFLERASTALAGVGGSTAAGLGNWWPLQEPPAVQVQPGGTGAGSFAAGAVAVTGGYFDALGIGVRNGRVFEARDTAAGEPVVVVSESVARRLSAAGSVVGQTLAFLADDGRVVATRRIVGVVGDVRQTHRDQNLLDVYLPLLQQPGRFAFLYVREPRSAIWEADIRAAVSAIDPESAVGMPRSLGEALDQERAGPRFLMRLLGVFASFASVLALVGLHGVIAYAARQRRREVAIRVAVGADARAITRLFLRQGLGILATGVAAGLWGATALGRMLTSYLHGVEPTDPVTIASAAAAFAICGLAAVWWPARRAATIDASRLLRL